MPFFFIVKKKFFFLPSLKVDAGNRLLLMLMTTCRESVTCMVGLIHQIKKRQIAQKSSQKKRPMHKKGEPDLLTKLCRVATKSLRKMMQEKTDPLQSTTVSFGFCDKRSKIDDMIISSHLISHHLPVLHNHLIVWASSGTSHIEKEKGKKRTNQPTSAATCGTFARIGPFCTYKAPKIFFLRHSDK